MDSDEKFIISCAALIFALIILMFYIGYKEVERLDEMYAECITTERDEFECHSLIYN